MPLPDASRFSVLMGLEREHVDVCAEGRALELGEFVPWPQRTAYSGDWLVFPLFLASAPGDLVVDYRHNQQRCPCTVAALRRSGRVVGAAFSRIGPGCHIHPHTDFPQPNVIRGHLGIRVPTGVGMRVGCEIVRWQEGRALVFDGQIEHEVANHGHEPRLVLLVDFLMTAAERAEVARVAAVSSPLAVH